MILHETIPAESESIFNSLRKLVRALRVYSREAENRLGLSAAQLFVLQQMQDEEPVALKELARRTMTDMSSVSAVVEKLVGKGLLERRRSQRDGRVLELWISAEGKLLLRQRPDAMQARLIKALASLKPLQRKALDEGLRSMLELAGLAGEKPVMLFETEEA